MRPVSQSDKTTTFEALLGILSLGPATGYEVRRRIERSIGNFWSESFGQIYPALNKLLKQGLVSATEEGKKGRKIYSLTPLGRERLEQWLAIPPQPTKPRNELLLKLFFGAQNHPGSVRAHVIAARDGNLANLEHYAAIEATLRKHQANNPGLPYFLITLHYGSLEARAHMDWADQTLEMLDQIDSNTASHKEKS